MHQKDTESIANKIMGLVEKDQWPFENCRQQCYDNVAVKYGHKSGVQHRLNTLNPTTIYVKSDNHSLNLVWGSCW